MERHIVKVQRRAEVKRPKEVGPLRNFYGLFSTGTRSEMVTPWWNKEVCSVMGDDPVTHGLPALSLCPGVWLVSAM